MRYVNLGCGARYHSEWINIDIAPRGAGVIAHDLSKGIPLDGNSCDMVYHAHVIEHLRREHVPGFIRECARVLKSGGILRIATPDLERIVRHYLEFLESAAEGDGEAAKKYDWIMLEMYDQTVREKSGGQMQEILARDPMPAESFVYERIGIEGREIVAMMRQNPPSNQRADNGGGASESMKRLFARLGSPMRTLRNAARRFGSDESLRTATEIGRFRLSGEVHQWMYDRYSLAKLLTEAGLQSPKQRTATTSGLAEWARFNLDATADGVPIKPDSIYMEAVKGDGAAGDRPQRRCVARRAGSGVT